MRKLFVTLVSLMLATVVGLTVTTAQNITPPAVGDLCIVSADVLQVHNEPSNTARVVGELTVGNGIVVSGMNPTLWGDWVKIDNGYIMWRAGSAVSMAYCAPQVEATPSDGRNALDVVATPFGDQGGGSAQAVSTATPVCIEKVRTFDMPTSGETSIMEVGGENAQMVEQYIPFNEGVSETIIFLVDPLMDNEAAARWLGWGSTWEQTELEGCSTFDPIQNARIYVADRASRNEGVTGLVVDLRGTIPVLVYNYKELEPAAIMALLNAFVPYQAGETNYEGLVFAAEIQSLCVDGSYAPVPDDAWEVGCPTAWSVVGFWTNWPGYNQAERKLLLNPGEFVTLNGGGSVTFYSTLEEAQAAYNLSLLPGVTLPQLTTEGLAVLGFAG